MGNINRFTFKLPKILWKNYDSYLNTSLHYTMYRNISVNKLYNNETYFMKVHFQISQTDMNQAISHSH